MTKHRPLFNTIIIDRSAIRKLAQQPEILRDKLIIELPRLQGFRTKEVATLRWEYIDEDERWIYVKNSKKYQLYPLPLSWQLAQLVADFRHENGGPTEGWVIKPLPTVNVKRSALGKPISNTAIEDVIKEYARQARIFNWQRYNPTLLRASFAGEWVRQQRSIKMLQAILRHNSPATTMRYVNRIIFMEELEAELDRIQRIPTTRRLNKSNVMKVLQSPMAKQCMDCPANIVCPYVEEAVQSEWAGSCKYYEKIMEKVMEIKIKELQRR